VAVFDGSGCDCGCPDGAGCVGAGCCCCGGCGCADGGAPDVAGFGVG